MEKNHTALEVLAKHSFATYEDWWKWDTERLRNGTSLVVEQECLDCGQLTIIDMEESESDADPITHTASRRAHGRR